MIEKYKERERETSIQIGNKLIELLYFYLWIFFVLNSFYQIELGNICMHILFTATTDLLAVQLSSHLMIQ